MDMREQEEKSTMKRSRVNVDKMIRNSLSKEDRVADVVRGYFGGEIDLALSPSNARFKPEINY
jgi:hypothetical protein